MGSRVQTVGCFPEMSFFQFSVALVRVGLRMHLINNFIFTTCYCAGGFNNNNNLNNNRLARLYSKTPPDKKSAKDIIP